MVNGTVEPAKSILTSPYDPSYVEPFVIEPGNVFVMGDNRPIALDSRDLGPVPTTSIKGKAVYLYAPINHARSLR